jgi:small GTP-binding protein
VCASSAKKEYRIKIVVAGDGGVGKTSLLNRYVSDTFLTAMKMTIGTDFFSKAMDRDDSVVKLQLWDFGGEKRFRFLLPGYCKGARGVLLAFDLNDFTTLMNLDEWIQIIKENTTNPKIMLVGTKVDIAGGVMEEEFIRDFCIKHSIDKFIPTSSKTGENVDLVFQELVNRILEPEIPEIPPAPIAPTEILEPTTPVEVPEPTPPLEIPEPITTPELPEPVTPPEIPEPIIPPEPTPTPEISELITPQEVPEPTPPPEIPELITPQEVPEPVTPPEISEPTPPPEIPELITPQEVPEPVTPPEISEPTPPPEIPEPTPPPEVPESIIPSEIPEPVTPPEIKEPIITPQTTEPVPAPILSGIEFTLELGEVKSRKVRLYLLSRGGFGLRALKFLRTNSIEFEYVFVDELDEKTAIELREKLKEKYGRHVSYPFLIIDEKKCLVGFDETEYESVFRK